uniref:Terpene synthase metal-binding domain-containing protein n=1 Tax=Salix viminalis TaxID=40686 RepID=A0A6N2LNT1_SALVM
MGIQLVEINGEIKWTVKENLRVNGQLSVKLHKDEQKRGDCAFGVECYMKQYNISEKKAIEEIQKMNAVAWKDINKIDFKVGKLQAVVIGGGRG